jgi:hypothetical protein
MFNWCLLDEEMQAGFFFYKADASAICVEILRVRIKEKGFEKFLWYLNDVTSLTIFFLARGPWE